MTNTHKVQVRFCCFCYPHCCYNMLNGFHVDVEVNKENENANTSDNAELVTKTLARLVPFQLQNPETINVGSSESSKSNQGTKAPKVVELAYKINCVSDVSAVSCTFEVDIKIFLYWTDDKLIGRKKGSFIDYEAEKDLFEPNIIVTNEHQLTVVEKDCNTKIDNDKTGGVKRTAHFKGTVFLGSMDLKMFPFDCQNLQVSLYCLSQLKEYPFFTDKLSCYRFASSRTD